MKQIVDLSYEEKRPLCHLARVVELISLSTSFFGDITYLLNPLKLKIGLQADYQ